jgi:hypothetical protein
VKAKEIPEFLFQIGKVAFVVVGVPLLWHYWLPSISGIKYAFGSEGEYVSNLTLPKVTVFGDDKLREARYWKRSESDQDIKVLKPLFLSKSTVTIYAAIQLASPIGSKVSLRILDSEKKVVLSHDEDKSIWGMLVGRDFVALQIDPQKFKPGEYTLQASMRSKVAYELPIRVGMNDSEKADE